MNTQIRSTPGGSLSLRHCQCILPRPAPGCVARRPPADADLGRSYVRVTVPRITLRLSDVSFCRSSLIVQQFSMVHWSWMSRLTSATTAKDYDYAEVQMRPRSRDSSDCGGLHVLPFALRESFEGGPLAGQHVELFVELLTSYVYMHDCVHAVVLVCGFLEVPEILSLTALNRSTHAGDASPPPPLADLVLIGASCNALYALVSVLTTPHNTSI